MADGTGIEWADATFNPWIGCTKISAACDFCYAERWGARFGVAWGNHPRRRTSRSYWVQPLRWDAQAKAAGIRKRVFCASLADWLDNQVDPVWRHELGILIAGTPNLDWLLLSKRPQNYEALAPWPVNDPPPNVSLGTTTENQDEADRRTPEILRWPAKWHFISAEPLLGAIDLTSIDLPDGDTYIEPLSGTEGEDGERWPALDLVIAGGESGPGARPMLRSWAQSLRDQCQAAGVAYFHKQNGEWIDADEWLDQINAGPGQIFGPGERRWDPPRPLNYTDARYLAEATGRAADHLIQHHSDGTTLIRVGKRAAGRLLDGREWNEVPA